MNEYEHSCFAKLKVKAGGRYMLTVGDFIWYQSSYNSNESESSDLINRVIWTLTPTLVVPTQDRELLW